MTPQELINYLKEFNREHNQEPEVNIESLQEIINNEN